MRIVNRRPSREEINSIRREKNKAEKHCLHDRKPKD